MTRDDAEHQNTRKMLRDADASIAALWTWWASLTAEARLAIAFGEDAELAEVLTDHVVAMHDGLVWEFGQGRTSEHALALSGEGDPVARLVDERWRRAGPGDDATWSYHTTRQAVPREDLTKMSLRLDDIEMPFGDARVSAVRDEVRPRLDVAVWHPAFARIAEDEGRQMAVYLLLDQTLGEAGTERWIGGIDVAEEEPESSIDLLGLLDEVETLASTTTDGTFAALKGADPETGSPIFLTVAVTVARWDHPFHDTWCDVSLPYAPDENGMPGAADLEAAHAFEDEIVALLGKHALLLGSATGAGVRHLWFYLDGDSEAAEELRAWAARQSRSIDVTTKFDPAWAELPI